ncbi:gfo/Idh/MocA family oxidoreductase [Aerococcus agrisoli]|uniref:Gfo/Idh/MocA family oxidoreductase n=1 Tax=Aerococcus agrisoli TaxID=2487350 RepID=A0A3N4G9Y6_9LACT|nr:Gfo/Idh/MocA family oxidoreductase [Aerococcus agrisoli]RPA59593.1 gfo/Idh/MocA family oxidoreductase [Aerococcus agrisoli]
MINWGIIGAGNIAHRFANSLAQVEGGHLYAVANRTIEKAQAFQADHPSDKAYGSYEELLNDENVDAVYIALPHQLHLEWIEKAFKAGKAVLSEKPATMNVTEAKEIARLQEKYPVFFMEAMKSRFTPAYEAVAQRIQAGEIGDITKITTSLCRVFDEATSSYHFQEGPGGCLLDMGIYNAGLMQGLLPGNYILQDVTFEMHPNNIEKYVYATFDVDGVPTTLESAFDRQTDTEAVITGTKGEIVVYDFHRPTSYAVTIRDGETEYIEAPYVVDDFYGEIKHVVDLLESGKIESDRMPIADTIAMADIISQIKGRIFPE